jgi:hypothetical protein
MKTRSAPASSPRSNALIAWVPDQQLDHLGRPGRDADAEQREGRRLEQHQCAEKFLML